MNKGYGLVLNGGGAKGAYQIGAWAALRQLELYDEITAVSGTSVGALNALLIGQDDFDKAINVWKTIKQEDITPFGSKNSGTENILEISSPCSSIGGGFSPCTVKSKLCFRNSSKVILI